MQIHQIYTYSSLRNYSYIIVDDESKTTFCIDPTDADIIEKFLDNKQLTLNYIINTHEHFDHFQGNEQLIRKYNSKVLAHKNAEGKIPGVTGFLSHGDQIEISKSSYFKVLDTPGHTFAHLCFVLVEDGHDKAVFTGDTLFNAGVGNCRSGSAKELYETVSKQLEALSDEVIVYPGHDYWKNNLGFTLSIEKENKKAKELFSDYSSKEEYLRDGNYPPSTIAVEKQINTFFRLSCEQVRSNLKSSGKLLKDNPSNEEVFLTLRQLRDRW